MAGTRSKQLRITLARTGIPIIIIFTVELKQIEMFDKNNPRCQLQV